MATSKTAKSNPAAKPRARKPAPPSTASRALSVVSFGALAIAAGAAVVELVRRLAARREGHAAPDLAPGGPHAGPGDRAPDAFRPDPTAPVSAGDREALRPALMPVPQVTDLQAELSGA